MSHLKLAFRALAFLAASLVLLPALPASAQDQLQEQKPLSEGELEALVAPIALYADPLLAKMLIAATYPLEIVQAARWREENKGLQAASYDSAVASQNWDQSVKEVAKVPDLIKMMSDRLDWTQKLGDAVLAQQEDVLKAIQRLRHKAQEAGTLKTTKEQTVQVVNASQGGGGGGSGGSGGADYSGGGGAENVAGGGGQTIVIQPTNPEEVYVPYYNTQTAYGDWSYPSYPPYYYPPPYGYGWAAAGLGFMAGAIVGGGWWNNGANWGGGYISNVNVNNFNNFRNTNWNGGNRVNHNAGHRRGVNYPNNRLRNQYGRGQLGGANGRQNFRGFDNNRGGRDGIGNNRGNNRGNVGNNRGNRGNVANNRGNNRGNAAGNRGGNRGNVASNRGGGRSNYGNAGNRGSNYGNRGGRSNYGNTSYGGNRGGYGGGYNRSSYGSRGGGFDGVGRGASTRNYSSRGRSSMGGRSSFGGGGRSYGGGGRGGGGMRGGGGGRGGGGRGGGGTSALEERDMRRYERNSAIFATALLWFALAGVAIGAGAAPKEFPSAKAASDALVTALRAHDKAALSTILGSEGDEIVSSGDAAADRNGANAFLASYDAKANLAQKDPSHVMLQVGPDAWEMPIPIVKGANGWHFDAAAGKDELLARRVGRNELYTIQAVLAYVDAQREYASKDRGDGVLDYAQRFMSSPGKKDGLYWTVSEGQEQSPLGPLFAQARSKGYGGAAQGLNTPIPYNGYYYKILTGQGTAAKGGAYDYMAKGKMIGGYALVAYPATYGNSGIKTFMVNQDGIVFEKDLGDKTTEIASKMTVFNPDKGWTKSPTKPVE
jgi:hypothetical protein